MLKVETKVPAVTLYELIGTWSKSDNFPQAMLWEIPRNSDIATDIKLLQKHFFCHKNACDQCPDCHWVDTETHPDSVNIVPDQLDGPIKIEAIRQLQSQSELTSFRGRGRLVIIKPAENMNLNAANSLLKILEEPTLSTHFILITHTMHAVPMTIKSRCVKYSNLISTNQVAHQEKILEMISSWCDVIEMKSSVCRLIKVWLESPLLEIVQALYIGTAQAIKCALGHETANASTQRLLNLISITNLFHIVDKLNAIIKKINQNIAMNETLALEDLLTTAIVM